VDLDQPLLGEVIDGFFNWGPTDLQFLRQCVNVEPLARRKTAPDDLFF
jgi:hypothetical protein